MAAVDDELASALVIGLIAAGPRTQARVRVVEQVRARAEAAGARAWLRLIDLERQSLVFEGAAGAIGRARLVGTDAALVRAIASEAERLGLRARLSYAFGPLIGRPTPLRRVVAEDRFDTVRAAPDGSLIAIEADDQPNLTWFAPDGAVRWRVLAPGPVMSIAVGGERVAIGGGPGDGWIEIRSAGEGTLARELDTGRDFARVAWIDEPGERSLLVADGGLGRWALDEPEQPRWRVDPDSLDQRPISRFVVAGDAALVLRVDDEGRARLDELALDDGSVRRQIDLEHAFGWDEPFEGNLALRPGSRTQLAWAPTLGDGEILGLDAETGATAWRRPGHAGGTTALVWIDDQTLLSAGADGVVREHRVDTDAPARTLDPRAGAILDLAWLGERRELAVVDEAGQLGLWSMDAFVSAPDLRPPLRASQIVRAGATVVLVQGSQLARWQGSSIGEPLRARPSLVVGSASHVVAASFARRGPRSVTHVEGRALATGEPIAPIELRGQARAMFVRADGRIALVFNQLPGEPSLRIVDPDGAREPEQGAREPEAIEAWQIATQTERVGDDEFWIAGNWQGSLERWRIDGRAADCARYLGHEAQVIALARGRTSWASVDQQGRLLGWPAEIAGDTVSPSFSHAHDQPPTALVGFAGGFVVGCADGRLIQYAADGARVRTGRGHVHAIAGLRPSPDGRLLASWDQAGLRVWTRTLGILGSFALAGGLGQLEWDGDSIVVIDAAGFVHRLALER